MKNRRSIINFSIKRKMQLRILGKVMGVALLALVLSSLIFYIYSNQEVGETYREFHVKLKNFLELLMPAIMISAVIGSVAALCLAIFFPHQIAGPLHRIEKILMERVGEGDLSVRFILRRGDEVEELADALNVTIEKLGERLKRVKSVSEKLSSLAGTKKQEELSPESVSEIAKEMEEAVKEFKL